jgi:hypothetical protein
MKNIDIESINVVLNDPRTFESRLVIVSNADNGVYGYLSADGEKIFKAEGITVGEILSKTSIFCKERLT